ncbi:MAG: tRNA lysidine(34) synthetase TilS [Cytophagales bacterium]|nr:tRNA lysidine(34) synthetase TilS [Cytophagales bacterium]
MKQAFLKFVEKEKLFAPEERVLLAVSGGLDSVVMAHLFHRSSFLFAVCHCNFQLRGADADGDADFVRELAQGYQAPFHSVCFDTRTHAAERGLSIEMAARELRYEWFQMLCREHSYDWLAAAHHKNDTAETMLLNLCKGTGIAGLHGIRAKHGNILRPLSFATRAQIEAYARKHGLSWREDVSNQDNAYQRNLIRNKVLPRLREINPDVENAFARSARRLAAAERIVQKQSDRLREQWVEKNRESWSIPLSVADELEEAAYFLHDWLKSVGFNEKQTENMLQSARDPKAVGKRFLSATHQAVRDREAFIISPVCLSAGERYFVSPETKRLDFSGQSLRFSHKDPGEYTISRNSCVGAFDFDKLTFPLELRRWEKGDRFKPLGLKGSKKVSDFLIDSKVPRSSKENIWVLCSGGRIVWLVGLRMDDRFKLTGKTTRVWEAELFVEK